MCPALPPCQVALLVERADLERASSRIVVRELLASCVLRPLLLYFTPYVRMVFWGRADVAREPMRSTCINEEHQPGHPFPPPPTASSTPTACSTRC